MENLFAKPNMAIAKKVYQDGLSNYTQSNCQVTLTDDGFRIYRPPNIIHDSSTMHNMWGGLKIRNSALNSLHEYDASVDNVFNLIKGNTYIVYFHVKGQSTNAATSVGWTNQMGWGGGGLSPNPSNVSYQYTPTNFNGEMECYYKFTINDDVVKTCTSTYSSFTQGIQYMSYYDFMYGFQYENTGSLGTDVYITNLRMYNITSGAEINFQKSGIIVTPCISQIDIANSNINNAGEILANNFMEI